ncbi:hypothetical protein [Pseudoduganella violaceinigra]|uniref:hypothetical protein n=1 Tax=Pseudoduganella violaceinigra TaxID=246602 RepID=UPI0012B585E8|nr:hypothetical protein [Pseudoduganella violaceinigra]
MFSQEILAAIYRLRTYSTGMIVKSKFGVRALFVCFAFALTVTGFLVWAKAAYGQPEAISVAKTFLLRLQSGDFESAHELTTKKGYVGKTAAELREFSQRHTCFSGRFVSTFPRQTNGNRLRRLFRGQDVDMDEVNVEFEGTCLLGVRLRRTSDKAWRVFYFASHAG